MRVYDILADELTRRMTPATFGGHPVTFYPPDTTIDYGPISYDILSVAERIAARTED